jgi:uncharacterized membrane protein YjfL (UPF0719 family)
MLADTGLGIAQVVIAALLAALAAYIGLYVVNRATRDVDEWAELRRGNPAIGIVVGAAIAGLAIILRPTLVLVEVRPDVAPVLRPLVSLGALALQFVLALLIGLLAMAFTLWLFNRLTRELDEVAELAKGNVAVAALLAGVLLAVALLVAPAVEALGRTLLAVVGAAPP